MTHYLEADYSSLLAALRHQPILSGSEVLGPNERFTGSLNHEYRSIDDNTALQIQNFAVLEPFDFRLIRKNLLAFQFTKAGAYQRTIADKLDFINPATVHITNAPNTTSHMTVIGQKLIGIGIFIERDYFIERYGLNIDSVSARYRPIFGREKGTLFPLKLPLSASSWSCVEQIVECALLEPLRSIYIRAKALELVCDVAAALNANQLSQHVNSASQNRMEQQMLQAAAGIYARELDNPPSVAEIATRVGLHRNRLITGFREMFMEPPSIYSRRLRMERARELLATSNLSINQVAERTGYTSHAAFTRAYHAHFGHSPSETIFHLPHAEVSARN